MKGVFISKTPLGYDPPINKSFISLSGHLVYLRNSILDHLEISNLS
jgi:hypothetical protein